MLYDPKWKQPKTKTEPWRQVLLKAADTIERCGWVQGCTGNETVGFCASGAIEFGAFCLALENPMRSAVEASKALSNYTGVGYIADWNDNSRRTKDQVVFTLRNCANAKTP